MNFIDWLWQIAINPLPQFGEVYYRILEQLDGQLNRILGELPLNAHYTALIRHGQTILSITSDAHHERGDVDDQEDHSQRWSNIGEVGDNNHLFDDRGLAFIQVIGNFFSYPYPYPAPGRRALLYADVNGNFFTTSIKIVDYDGTNDYTEIDLTKSPVFLDLFAAPDEDFEDGYITGDERPTPPPPGKRVRLG